MICKLLSTAFQIESPDTYPNIESKIHNYLQNHQLPFEGG